MGETYSKPVKEPYPTTLVIKKKTKYSLFDFIILIIIITFIIPKKASFQKLNQKYMKTKFTHNYVRVNKSTVISQF